MSLAAYLVFLIFLLTYAEGKHADHENNTEPDLFEKAIRSGHYVDKTLLIEKILRAEKSIYVTAPDRFGKTTNLAMLRRYFEIEYFKNGTILNKNDSTTHELFSTTVGSKPLAFFEQKIKFYAHFGRYPVVYLDFCHLGVKNFNTFRKSILSRIAAIYASHEYLKKSKHLNSTDLSDFSSFTGDPDDISDFVLRQSIKRLCLYLYKHWGKRSVVLVHEFDGVVPELIRNKVADMEIESVVDFMGDFVGQTITFNDFLNKSVLVGCSYLGSVFSYQINDITSYHFLVGERIGPYFGFTEKEVSYLAKKHNYKDVDGLKTWFGGYREERKEYIYNMQSVLDVVVHKKPLGVQWESSKEILRGFWVMFSQRNVGRVVKDVLSDIPFNIAITRIVTYDEVIYLKKCFELEKFEEKDLDEVDIFFQYLFENGYLSPCDRIYGGSVNLTAPNSEVKELFKYALKFAIGKEYELARVETTPGVNVTKES